MSTSNGRPSSNSILAPPSFHPGGQTWIMCVFTLSQGSRVPFLLACIIHNHLVTGGYYELYGVACCQTSLLAQGRKFLRAQCRNGPRSLNTPSSVGTSQVAKNQGAYSKRTSLSLRVFFFPHHSFPTINNLGLLLLSLIHPPARLLHFRSGLSLLSGSKELSARQVSDFQFIRVNVIDPR